jgi:glycerophosphoryl diester phosphodiesterase
MRELMPYIERESGILVPGEVIWSHAVNSLEKLHRIVADKKIHIVESDIRVNKAGEPVCVHPPETESDLSFVQLLEIMKLSEKGLKLDFKDPEIVEVCLKLLKGANLAQPILLNADILQGQGANPSKFNAQEFLDICDKEYPDGMLSVGWTTNTIDGYTRENVEEMVALIAGRKNVTFPVRACLLEKSWDSLTELLNIDETYTLSIWNNEDVTNAEWIRRHTNPQRCFYDFIDMKNNKESIRLW